MVRSNVSYIFFRDDVVSSPFIINSDASGSLVQSVLDRSPLRV